MGILSWAFLKVPVAGAIIVEGRESAKAESLLDLSLNLLFGIILEMYAIMDGDIYRHVHWRVKSKENFLRCRNEFSTR